MNTSVQGLIDNFYGTVDVSYTPSAMEIRALINFKVQNGSAVEKVFVFNFNWYEDGATINTRLKNIWAAFTAGLTAMEAASTYTTVISISVSAILEVTYS